MKLARWTRADIPDQSGRVALITGANTGIGFEAANALAARGARVLLACRNVAKAEEARARITRDTTRAEVTVVALDLADLESIARAVEHVCDTERRLDLLINNAGIMAIPRAVTADGFEMQFGTNHLGHFALTGRLLGLLLATPGSRVVNVSSLAHEAGRLDFDDLVAARGYSRWGRYGASKVANLLFTYELQRRLARAGATTIAVACHPGVAATELARNAGGLIMRGAPLMRPFMQSAAMGALPTLRAATDSAVEGGQYYGPAGPGEWRGYPMLVKSSAYSRDESVAARLWTLSESLTGVTFRLPG